MKLYAAPLSFRGLASEFGVPTDFPPEVLAEADTLRDRFASKRLDARGIELVTIDPPGSQDLDQAVCIEERAGGYRVHYAIADVAAFVEPAGEVKRESLVRGQTIYLPDEPARLHPPAISEDAASLLPGVDRPAVLWTFDLDESGEVDAAHVERALVRSHAAGTGPLLDDAVVRLIIALKVAALARGHSGVRQEVVDALVGLVNRGVTPCIPGQGSVGA